MRDLAALATPNDILTGNHYSNITIHMGYEKNITLPHYPNFYLILALFFPNKRKYKIPNL